MIAGILDFIFGSALRLVLLLIGLLPTVSLNDLPLRVPDPVRDALGALNWFVPIGDMITIVSWWIGLLLAVNAVILITRILDLLRK